MAFKSEDIYTASGDVKVFNSWTPYVTKFDTSSFYNWEQDNLPLYDLEERTYALWEQQGWHTSSIPGLAFTVSADASQASLDAESTLFNDLSSAIAAVPKVVRFPVLIEVGSFGELGPLELHNFRIEEGGSIEIINRAFGRYYSTSSVANSIVSLTNPSLENKSIALINEVSSIETSGMLEDASCVHLGIPVLSATLDARLGDFGGAYIYPKHSERKGALSVAVPRTATMSFPSLSLNNIGIYELYATTQFSDQTLATYDISATSDVAGTALKRTDSATTEDITGNLYGNSCSKISVKNCDGPVYIRGFNAYGINEDEAISIVNSDVVLENCAATRARRAGFKFNNSRVVLSRSAFSYRNYNLLNVSTREAGVGAGLHAVNSDITVSSVPAAVGTSDGAKDYGASGSDAVFVFSRNHAGIILENSKIHGGLARETETNEDSGGAVVCELNDGVGIKAEGSVIDLNGLVDLYGNKVGLHANNTTARMNYFCAEHSQDEGILAHNSHIEQFANDKPESAGQTGRLAQTLFSENGQHLVLEGNSKYDFEIRTNVNSLYGATLFLSGHGEAEQGGGRPNIFLNSGSTAHLLGTRISVHPTTAGGFGSAVRAVNGSTARFYGIRDHCTFVGRSGGSVQTDAALFAGQNSTIGLHGPTVIGNFGVNVLAEDNSVIDICPPKLRTGNSYDGDTFNLTGTQASHTSVELHSTRACLVANRNSTINLTDLGDYEDNWNRGTIGSNVILSGVDWTSRGSVANLIKGGSLQFYPNPVDTATLTANGQDDLALISSPATRPSFTNGAVTNTFLVNDTVVNGTHDTSARGDASLGGVCVRVLGNSVVNAHNVHFPSGNNGGNMDGLIYNASGSDCDRLMIWNIADNSKLNASYISVSGLHPADASYYHGPSAVYVSSTIPGSNAATYNFASGAPAGTPDTGVLSVLDSFGAGSGNLWGGQDGIDVNSPFDRYSILADNGAYISELSEAGITTSGATYTLNYGYDGSSGNTGPFRIYWSVSPAAKVLANDLSGYANGEDYSNFSGVVGPAYQVFSQGYNCSAALSALPAVGDYETSAFYPQLLKFSRDTDGDGIPNTYATSGFYYCSEFVEDNPTQCMLDESAGHAFANAKNATLGSSGRPKKVTIYKAEGDSNDTRGSESYQGDTEATVGFRSSNTFDLRRNI